MEFELCEQGVINLATGIVMKSVQDYCECIEGICLYSDKEYIIPKIIKRREERGEFLTPDEADVVRYMKIQNLKIEMEGIIKFIESDWYRELCPIAHDYTIKEMKYKSVEDMVWVSIRNLKRINEKNKNSHRTKVSIANYKRLKAFLESDWLQELTPKNDSEYWLNLIREQCSETRIYWE